MHRMCTRRPPLIPIILICIGLLLFGKGRLDDFTGPHQHVHCVTQYKLPDANVCLVVLPATTERGGALELWYAPHTASLVQKLSRLPGAPPVTTPVPRPTPAIQWA